MANMVRHSAKIDGATQQASAGNLEQLRMGESKWGRMDAPGPGVLWSLPFEVSRSAPSGSICPGLSESICRGMKRYLTAMPKNGPTCAKAWLSRGGGGATTLHRGRHQEQAGFVCPTPA